MDTMFSLNDMTSLQAFSELLATRLRKQDFLTYFQKLSLVTRTDNKIVFGVVSEFIRDNIHHRFGSILLVAAKEIWVDVLEIEVVVDHQIENPTYAYVIDCRQALKNSQATVRKTQKEEIKTVAKGREDFSDRYDLTRFVVGPSNQLAYSAVEAVVRKPGLQYNPLFIYSEVGL